MRCFKSVDSFGRVSSRVEPLPARALPLAGARENVLMVSRRTQWDGVRCRQAASQDSATTAPPPARPPPYMLTADNVAESVERVVVHPVFRAAPWEPAALAQQETKPQACLLLVSESDVCRTVLAAAALQQLLQEAGLEGAVQVTTCGTRPYNVGEGPEAAAATAVEALGLTLPPSHAARLFNPAVDIVAADLLLVMDKFTAGDVMREVSSFDLVNRSTQFSYKVRRLGEFFSAATRTTAAPPAEYGSEGDELDIEDPLYGNVGGTVEEMAVLRTARIILQSCRGLVDFLRSVQDEATAQVAREAEEEEAALAAAEDEAVCELPLPGEEPVCSSGSSAGSYSSEDEEGDSAAARGGRSRQPLVAPLGPALRSRVLTMSPTAWLAPPMLSPRVDRDKLPEF